MEKAGDTVGISQEEKRCCCQIIVTKEEEAGAFSRSQTLFGKRRRHQFTRWTTRPLTELFSLSAMKAQELPIASRNGPQDMLCLR